MGWYEPKARELVSALELSSAQRLDDLAPEIVCGPFGSEITQADYVQSGIPLLRVANIAASHSDDYVFIEPGRLPSLAKFEVQDGDLVIAQRGTTGASAVVGEDVPAGLISANLIAVKGLGKFRAQYVKAVIDSTLGKVQLRRMQSGQAHPKITTTDVRRLLIPRVRNDRKLLAALSDAGKKSELNIAQAGELLKGMDQFLIDTLRIQLIPASNQRSFVVAGREFTSVGRLGVQFLHPDRLATRDAINRTTRLSPVELGAIAQFVRDQTPISEDTKFLGLASVTRDTGELTGATEEAEGTAFRFQPGDVLMARLRPYLNKVYLADFEGTCSTEFYVLRVNNNANVSADYLAVLLRSELVTRQTAHMMTGNTHPRIAAEDAPKILLAIPTDPALQSAVVTEMKRRQVEARALIQRATQIRQDGLAKFEKALLGAEDD